MYRFFMRSVINVVSAALILGVLLGGGLLLRLAWGPIPLDLAAPRVAEEVNRNLATEAPGWQVAIEGGAIRFDRESARLRLLLSDVALKTPSGEVAVRAPEVAFRFSPWKAVQGDLRVHSIELIGARAIIRRTPEGRFRLAVLDLDQAARAEADRRRDVAGAREEAAEQEVATETAEDSYAAVAAMLDALTRGTGGPEIVSQLESVVISRLDLTYEDALGGAEWQSSDARLSFTRSEDGVRARLEADVETGGDWPPVKIEVTGARTPGGRVVDLVADIREASPALIASQVAELDFLKSVHALVEGRLRSRVDIGEGRLDGVSASLAFDAGYLERSNGQPLVFDEAELAIAYVGDEDRVVLQQARYVGEGLELEAHGDLTIAPSGVVEGSLIVGPGRIANPEFVVRPIEVRGGSATFVYRPEPDPDLDALSRASLDIGPLVLDLGQTRFSGTVAATIEDASLRDMTFTAGLGTFAATELANLWVTGLAPGAQRWIDENIIGGRIVGLSATGALRRDPSTDALDAERLDVNFSFEDLAGTYLDDMTAITGGFGDAHLDLDSFSLAIDRAQVDLGAAGVLDLSGSRFDIPDINADPTPSTIAIRAAGPSRALLTLIDQEPLGFVTRIGLDPASVDGTVASVTNLELPLLRDLPLEDVSAQADASLKNLSLRPAAADMLVRFREASLGVDTKTLTLSGDAQVDGAPLSVDWTEVFAPGSGEPRSRVAFSGRLDQGDLAARGVPVDTLGIEGRTRVSGELRLADGRAPSLSLRANLKGLGMALPALGWRKPADAAGSLRLSGTLREQGARFDAVSLQAAGLEAEGALQLRPNGGLSGLSLSQLSVGRTRISAEISGGADNSMSIKVRGAGFDLVPVLDGFSGDRSSDLGVLAFDVHVGSLHLTPSLALADATIAGRREAAGVWAEINGSMARGATRISLAPEGENLRFDATSSNAGDTMRALGFVEDAHGGTIEAEGVVEPGGRTSGTIVIKSIVIKNAPVLAEILSIGTVFGAFDKLATGGISFETVDGDFVVDPTRVRILEAAAVGPSLGMSLDGAIDRKSGALDLAGSVSPAFVLNGLISGVPVLGDILTGGDGQGILGFAYRVSGTSDNPSVRVNPLSALAPGPFRRIFTDTDAARKDREAAGPPRDQSAPALDLR